MTKIESADQWKRGGICDLCKRKNYCKTQCRANRDYAEIRLKEYIRRRLSINKIEQALHPDGKETP